MPKQTFATLARHLSNGPQNLTMPQAKIKVRAGNEESPRRAAERNREGQELQTRNGELEGDMQRLQRNAQRAMESTETTAAAAGNLTETTHGAIPDDEPSDASSDA